MDGINSDIEITREIRIFYSKKLPPTTSSPKFAFWWLFANYAIFISCGDLMDPPPIHEKSADKDIKLIAYEMDRLQFNSFFSRENCQRK